ncbi:DEKNAAC102450 [Brettanomyces naardenensis]|uniref:Autophagy-related protein 27 n=1 Tax=Brettanomyces naardenensis TaxID=13370 RepID=A0A448YKE5_BRENA|nr:DEKNAAC102450 [Brettanomyces naardenensis]
MLERKILCVFLLLSTGLSIDLSNKAFKDYNAIKEIAGIHDIEKSKSTPPSTTTQKWYINMVDPSRKDLPKDMGDIKECPSGSQICGLTTIKLPGSDSEEITSEIFSFSSKLVPQFKEEDDGKLSVSLKGANWGDSTLDAVLNLKCTSDDDETLDATFDYSSLKVNWKNKLFCKDQKAGDGKNKKDHKDGDKKEGDKSHDGWGAFTWIFILLVLALAVYIIGQAWINTSRVGSSSDFFNELGDASVETLGKVPEFVKQVVTKVTGGADRGGYSAV